MDNFLIYKIFYYSRPEDVLSWLRVNRKFKYSQDVIFKNLLKDHFFRIVKRKETYKEEYIFIVSILKEKIFNSIIEKHKDKQLLYELTGGGFLEIPYNIIQLLYENSWGIGIKFLTFDSESFINIVKNIKSDIREEIQKIRFINLYCKKQIEFLQILHDAVQNEVISLFDPLIFSVLISKLKKEY
jgi:hypothetical protein